MDQFSLPATLQPNGLMMAMGSRRPLGSRSMPPFGSRTRPPFGSRTSPFGTRFHSSRLPPPHPPMGLTDEQIMKRSIDMSFGILVMILNVVEIVIISRMRNKKKIYEIMILSLSVTDLLFGLSNTVISAIYLSRNANADEILEISYTTYFYFVLNSILHLTFIALDRLYAVLRPFHHRVFVTKKKVRILIGLLWFTSTLIAGSLFLADELTETFAKNTVVIEYENITSNGSDTTVLPILFTTTTMQSPRITRPRPSLRPGLRRKMRIEIKHTYSTMMQLTLSIFIVVADVILFVSYIFIIYTVRKSKKAVKIKDGRESEDRVLVICLFIAASFIVFTLPYAIARFKVGHIPLWANLILVSNSGMNSIIYFFRGKCEQWQKKWMEDSKLTQSGTSTTPLSTPNMRVRHLVLEENRSNGTTSSTTSLNEASV